jgi:hypothetical protein
VLDNRLERGEVRVVGEDSPPTNAAIQHTKNHPAGCNANSSVFPCPNKTQNTNAPAITRQPIDITAKAPSYAIVGIDWSEFDASAARAAGRSQDGDESVLGCFTLNYRPNAGRRKRARISSDCWNRKRFENRVHRAPGFSGGIRFLF